MQTFILNEYTFLEFYKTSLELGQGFNKLRHNVLDVALQDEGILCLILRAVLIITWYFLELPRQLCNLLHTEMDGQIRIKHSSRALLLV